jgi:hypothetical protein
MIDHECNISGCAGALAGLGSGPKDLLAAAITPGSMPMLVGVPRGGPPPWG